MNELKKRILEISKKLKLAHVGSNLSAVDIIDEIYKKKKYNDIFVLSSGHAHLAHLVVRFKAVGHISYIIEKFGIHCDIKADCTVSTGSLGHGLPIAVGMALADRKRQVYCLTSDGEWMEGSMWEAIRIAEQLKLKNLHITVNANGYGGMKPINSEDLLDKLMGFNFYCDLEFIRTDNKPLSGLKAHYERVI